jgi:hypothetical protein
LLAELTGLPEQALRLITSPDVERVKEALLIVAPFVRKAMLRDEPGASDRPRPRGLTPQQMRQLDELTRTDLSSPVWGAWGVPPESSPNTNTPQTTSVDNDLPAANESEPAENGPEPASAESETVDPVDDSVETDAATETAHQRLLNIFATLSTRLTPAMEPANASKLAKPLWSGQCPGKPYPDRKTVRSALRVHFNKK